MTINAIIVDYEELCSKSLYHLIKDNCPQVKIFGIAKSVEEAKILLSVKNIDLVFLDIYMPKEDGFKLLPILQEKTISVIFTTSNDQYALSAIKASAADYLIKPINPKELIDAVSKVSTWKMLLEIKSLYETKYTNSLNNLLQNINDTNSIQKITLPHNHGFHVLEVRNIIYIEADSNYSNFHLKNNEKIIVSKPLKEYEDILDPLIFVRIHKSTIINLEYLKNYSNNTGIVSLQYDIELPVSRRRVTHFLDIVKAFFNSKNKLAG